LRGRAWAEPEALKDLWEKLAAMIAASADTLNWLTLKLSPDM
jgi:hypothetical protein